MQSNSLTATLPVASPAAIPLGVIARWSKLCRIDPAVFFTVAGRCVGLAAGLIGSVVTARYLQPAGRGEYFLALTTAQLVAQFGNLGLQSGNTYFVARDRSLFGGLLANSVWISFLAVPLVAVLLFVASLWGWTGGATPATGWFVVALAPLFVFNLLGCGLFVGLNQMKTYSFVQPLSAALLLPCVIVAATLGCGPSGFLMASLVAWGITTAIMLVLLLRQNGGVGGFRTDVFLTTCKYSTKAYLATLTSFMVLRMNVFILHAVGGAEQVGYYSIASQIADTLSILPQSMATVLFPRLVANQTGRLRATMSDAGKVAVLLGVACVGVWLFGGTAIHLAFGPRFAPAVPVLRAMLPGVLLLGVMSVVSQYLAASGFPVSVVVCWFLSVVLCGGLSRSLIARYGAVGAGAALSVTYAALLVAMLFLCWRTARSTAGNRRPQQS